MALTYPLGAICIIARSSSLNEIAIKKDDCMAVSLTAFVAFHQGGPYYRLSWINHKLPAQLTFYYVTPCA